MAIAPYAYATALIGNSQQFNLQTNTWKWRMQEPNQAMPIPYLWDGIERKIKIPSRNLAVHAGRFAEQNSAAGHVGGTV